MSALPRLAAALCWALASACTCAPPAPATPCDDDGDCPIGFLCEPRLRYCYAAPYSVDAASRDTSTRDHTADGPGLDGGTEAGEDGATRVDAASPAPNPVRLNGPPEGLRYDLEVLGLSPDRSNVLASSDPGLLHSVPVDGASGCTWHVPPDERAAILGFDLSGRRAVVKTEASGSVALRQVLGLALDSCDRQQLLAVDGVQGGCRALFSTQANTLVHTCAANGLQLVGVDLDDQSARDLSGDLGSDTALRGLDLAPDGLTVVATLRDAVASLTRLHAARLDLREDRVLASDPQLSLSFAFSPDSRSLGFASSVRELQSEITTLWAVDLDQGEPQAVDSGPMRIRELIWPAADLLVYTGLEDNNSAFNVARRSDNGWEVERPFPGEKADQLALTLPAPRVLALLSQNSDVLYSIDLSQPPSQRTRLSQTGERVSEYLASPDSAQVAYRWHDAAFARAFLSLVAGDGTGNHQLCELSGYSAYTDLAFSPDGQQMVVRGEIVAEDENVLSTYPVIPGQEQRLDDVRLEHGDVSGFWPLDQGVLYQADQDTNELFALFVVPYTGGVPLEIGPAPRLLGGGVQGWRLVPGGSRVVYWSDEQLHGPGTRIYRVEIDGRARTALTDDLGDRFYVDDEDAFLTPDGSTLIFQSGLGWGPSILTLDLEGGPPVRLDQPSIPSREIFDVALSPDGEHVAFCGDLESGAETMEVAHLDGSPLTKLYSAQTGGQPDCFEWREGLPFAPDGSRLVWMEESPYQRIVTDKPTGGDRVVLSEAMLVTSPIAPRPILTPNSTRIIWSRYEQDTGAISLVSTPLLGGSSDQLSPAELLEPAATPRVTQDSSRVVFGGLDAEGQIQVWSAALDGSDRVRLGLELDLGQGTVSLALAEDDTAVLFSDSATQGARHLWISPVAGGTPILLAEDLVVSGGYRGSFREDPRNDRVLYLGVDAQGQHALRAVGRDGTGNVQLSQAFDDSAELITWEVLDGSGHILLYEGHLENWFLFAYLKWHGIWFMAPDGSQRQRVAAGEIERFELTPDERRLIYDLTEDEALGIRGLWAWTLPPWP